MGLREQVSSLYDRTRSAGRRAWEARHYVSGKEGTALGQFASVVESARGRKDIQLVAGGPKQVTYGDSLIVNGQANPDGITRLMRRKYGVEPEIWNSFDYYCDIYRYVPIVRSIIENRIAINGITNIESKSGDKGLVREMRDRWDSIPVGYYESEVISKGGDSFLDTQRIDADRLGLGIGEIMPDISRGRVRGIERLMTPDVTTFSVHKRQDRSRGGVWLHDIIQFSEAEGLRRIDGDGGIGERSVRGAFMTTCAYRCISSSLWPLPLTYGTKPAIENIMRLVISSANTITRAGHPTKAFVFRQEDTELEFDDSDLWTTKLPNGNEYSMPVPVVVFHNQMQTWMQQMVWGDPSDIAMYLKGLELDVHDMFENTAASSVIDELETLMRIFEAQLVNVSGTPPALYGFGDSVGQGMQGANKLGQQMGIAMQHAMKRRKQDRAIVKRVLSWQLIGEGRPRFIDDLKIEFDSSGLLNEHGMEETRSAKAKADAQFIRNAIDGASAGVEVDEMGIPVEGAEGLIHPREYLEANNVIQAEESI